MRKMKNITFTVLLPVYNGDVWLERTLVSLLKQSRTDFELLVIDDGSKDKSLRIVQKYVNDFENLRVIKVNRIGLANALNIGISQAETDIIFRQDQDDISLASRFEKQFDFLVNHPEIVAVGTGALVINESDEKIGKLVPYTNFRKIKIQLLLENQIIHSSVAFRRDEIINIGGYYAPNSEPYPEDYDLWSRVSQNYKISNIKEPLIQYRMHSRGISSQHSQEISNHSSKISFQNISKFLEIHNANFEIYDGVKNYTRKDRKISLIEIFKLWHFLFLIKSIEGYRTHQLGFSYIYYVRPVYWFLKKLFNNKFFKFVRSKIIFQARSDTSGIT